MRVAFGFVIGLLVLLIVLPFVSWIPSWVATFYREILFDGPNTPLEVRWRDNFIFITTLATGIYLGITINKIKRIQKVCKQNNLRWSQAEEAVILFQLDKDHSFKKWSPAKVQRRLADAPYLGRHSLFRVFMQHAF